MTSSGPASLAVVVFFFCRFRYDFETEKKERYERQRNPLQSGPSNIEIDSSDTNRIRYWPFPANGYCINASLLI